MPSQYSDLQKQHAMSMLAIGDDIGFVHNSTGIPERTLRLWRKQLNEQPDCQIAKKPSFPPIGQSWAPYAYPAGQNEFAPIDHADSATYSDLENFTYIRGQLMAFARAMARDLRPLEPESNRRTLALSRVLERIKWIDSFLPDLVKEEERAPWQDAYDALLALDPDPHTMIDAEKEAKRLDPRLRASHFERVAERYNRKRKPAK